MGRGIAQVAATAGLHVTLLDAQPELAARGHEGIVAALDRLVGKGKLTTQVRDEIAARIEPASAYAACAGVDLVIEAASEQLAVKEAIFRELDRVCRPDAILASNTSSISITHLASCTGRPDRVIGIHFMNPVPVMKLCEIIRGLATSDATHEAATALAALMGKDAVTSRDAPGFIVNRILMPLINEAVFALSEGVASAADVDKAIVLGLNHPMGPLALADLIGLDTTLAILQVLHRDLGDDKYRPCPLLRQYVAAGWLGRKAGRGFFAY
jgi:3-hydroxybutyryl-CoA dehydrogenase